MEKSEVYVSFLKSPGTRRPEPKTPCEECVLPKPRELPRLLLANNARLGEDGLSRPGVSDTRDAANVDVLLEALNGVHGVENRAPAMVDPNGRLLCTADRRF
eukprot:CAMPEP_0174705042 /NCGR_PEP_ID=MMETSP1094-20130205/8410_1 /TAXON_ID=156173 /ORGANISM="Chrysochromulina brevifilum, Strain UTEX LB 985" /LENGTH=101 /DNA_ID=CAMNT_0015903161 /DNA_START=642 /DNA_END=947 /DNA_ORIENTATION=+